VLSRLAASRAGCNQKERRLAWDHISDHSGEYLADTYLAHSSGAERTAYANISPDPLNAAAGIAWGHACKPRQATLAQLLCRMKAQHSHAGN
jgi:hypothetical protein